MDHRRTLWRYMPLAVIFITFFIIPVEKLFLLSFLPYSGLQGIGDTLTIENYWEILTDTFELRVIARTLALCVSVMAYPLALYLTVASCRIRSLVMTICLAPLLVNVVVRTLGWVILLGPHGVLDRLAALIGLPVLRVRIH